MSIHHVGHWGVVVHAMWYLRFCCGCRAVCEGERKLDVEDLNLWSRVGQSDPQLSWPTLSWTGSWELGWLERYRSTLFGTLIHGHINRATEDRSFRTGRETSPAIPVPRKVYTTAEESLEFCQHSCISTLLWFGKYQDRYRTTSLGSQGRRGLEQHHQAI